MNARKWIGAVLAIGCATSAGCGGKKGTLTVNLVTPQNVDPFAAASAVHVQVGDPVVAEDTAPVVEGMFSLDVRFKPKKNSVVSGAIVVEALSSSGQVVARGRSPLLGLRPVDESVSVWVSRAGQVDLAGFPLSHGGAGMTAAAIPGFGVLFTGGTDDGGTTTAADVYDGYDVTVTSGQPLGAARPGAVGLGAARSDQAVGLALLAGGEGTPELSAFDPTSGAAGIWQTLASDPSLERSNPAQATLADGTVLLVGGTEGGAPLKTATVVTVIGQLGVKAVAAEMASARVGHTATQARFSDGDGALIFGGDAGGANDMAAEAYLSSARIFRPLDLGVPTRTGHTALLLPESGHVLVIGGREPEGVTDSALDIDPSAGTAKVIDGLLSTPRADLTATLLDDGTVLACGGSDASGVAQQTCDVIDSRSLTRTKTLTLSQPRTRHLAVRIDTGALLLIGGVNARGEPIKDVEVYMPYAQ